MAGTILEVNAGLESAPESVNTDAYGAGWMVKVKVSNPDEFNSLLDAEKYGALIG